MTREEAIEVLKDWDGYFIGHSSDDVFEALDMAIKALEQEPSGDLISRQATLEPYKTLKGTDTLCVALIRANIMQQPSVKQEPKIGHWIKSNVPNEEYVCSECGGACWYYDYQADVAKSRYCPNCGAKMIEQKESEE